MRDPVEQKYSKNKGNQLEGVLKTPNLFTPRDRSPRDYHCPRSKQLNSHDSSNFDSCYYEQRSQPRHKCSEVPSGGKGYPKSQSIAEKEFSVSRQQAQSRQSGALDSIDANLERFLDQKQNRLKNAKNQNIYKQKRNSIQKYQGNEKIGKSNNLLGIPHLDLHSRQGKSIVSEDDKQSSNQGKEHFMKLGRLHSANPALSQKSAFSKLTPILESQSSLSDDILKDQRFDSEFFENGFKSAIDC